jgi:tetratricopeptide (TPR) repeat protein
MRGLLLTAAVLAGAGIVGAQIDPRTAIVERAAWDALARGQAHAAAEAFRDALTADPKNARLHLGAAMAAALERRDAEATAEAERALAIEPSMPEARALLGQLLYRTGDLAGAIRVYDAFAADSSSNAGPSVQATLERWRRELALHDRMQRTIDSHFTVSFEGPEEAEAASRALESLDRAYWRVGEVLSVYVVDPIGVVLYTREQFTDITRSPAWAAGAYNGIIRVPMRGALESPEEMDRVLAHEFTHALIHSIAARGVPTWLNEGLASALESGDLDWAVKRVTASSPVPLRALQSGFGRFSGADALLAYATSAVAARRLLDEAGGVAVANLLRDLGEGAPFEDAFLRRIQRPFAEFQRSLL